MMEGDLERLFQAARSGDLEEVKSCISPENLNEQGPLGMTVVGEACRAGHKNVVKFLIESGADIGDVLHLACEFKDVDMVMLLLSTGVSVNSVDKYVKTPLHVAVERQSVVVVEALLKHGALVDKVDRFQCQSPLHVACKTDCVDVVTSLLTNGAQINLKDSSSQTPLHLAVSVGKSLDVVRSLLNHSKVVLSEVDRYGDTALHKASERGRLDIVRLLLQYGAPVNKPNRRRLTPLHFAVDNSPVLSILLDFGSGTQKCDAYACPCTGSVLQCLYEFEFRTMTTVKTFERHFIKVQTANISYAEKFPWDPKHSNGWGQKERDLFSTNCLDEIEKMKTHKIGETNCSYYDLLCRKKSALGNEKLRNGVSSDIWREFPIYGDMLYCSYLRVPEFLKRRELITKSSRFFELTKFDRLPPELVPLILEYLSSADLERLIEIFETPRIGAVDALKKCEGSICSFT